MIRPGPWARCSIPVSKYTLRGLKFLPFLECGCVPRVVYVAWFALPQLRCPGCVFALRHMSEGLSGSASRIRVGPNRFGTAINVIVAFH